MHASDSEVRAGLSRFSNGPELDDQSTRVIGQTFDMGIVTMWNESWGPWPNPRPSPQPMAWGRVTE